MEFWGHGLQNQTSTWKKKVSQCPGPSHGVEPEPFFNTNGLKWSHGNGFTESYCKLEYATRLRYFYQVEERKSEQNGREIGQVQIHCYYKS